MALMLITLYSLYSFLNIIPFELYDIKFCYHSCPTVESTMNSDTISTFLHCKHVRYFERCIYSHFSSIFLDILVESHDSSNHL